MTIEPSDPWDELTMVSRISMHRKGSRVLFSFFVSTTEKPAESPPKRNVPVVRFRAMETDMRLSLDGMVRNETIEDGTSRTRCVIARVRRKRIEHS
jgi:hypothetical protein